MPEFNTDFYLTVSGLAICLGLGLLSWKLHMRENNSVKPRMVPWIIIAMGCLATGFMLLVHLVNLFGFETGGRF
ncbi:MAG: hypothetical protein EX271_04555 [Acidimicrobiales bacterium]|nr:hypothetical protein [Hyphomonadaceae bacterium]RZV43090.1 MAG: hypothetical protein EX271_04555 [Acidimicrobiales bacterium]